MKNYYLQKIIHLQSSFNVFSHFCKRLNFYLASIYMFLSNITGRSITIYTLSNKQGEQKNRALQNMSRSQVHLILFSYKRERFEPTGK